MENKKAVILLNLGGPKDLQSVKSFLFNLFSDKAIIDLPNPFRYLLAKFISIMRHKKSQGIYASIGNKSPILENTELQAKKLDKLLEEFGNYKVFVAMRYTSPRSEEVINEINNLGIKEVILIPLYPQFSTTTTESSINEFKKLGTNLNIKSTCCYPIHEKFILAHVNLILDAIKNLDRDSIRIIFTAHSLPVKVIEKGDPYQWQVKNTVSKIMDKLSSDGEIDYIISYQSKVGRLKWLEPSTEQEIIKASKENKILVVVPVSFVSEHSETLYELDIEYKKIAENYNCKKYIRVPTLGDNDLYIDFLKDLVLGYQEKRICPETFCKCISRI